MSVNTQDKIADWKECEECDGKGCRKCSDINPGYVLVSR